MKIHNIPSVSLPRGTWVFFFEFSGTRTEKGWEPLTSKIQVKQGTFLNDVTQFKALFTHPLTQILTFFKVIKIYTVVTKPLTPSFNPKSDVIYELSLLSEFELQHKTYYVITLSDQINRMQIKNYKNYFTFDLISFRTSSK